MGVLPPHSTALTPPLPFPQPPPLPVVLVELWEFSGFWLTPSFSSRPFITLSQIFVLADKSLVLELSPGGQAVRAGGPLDTIQSKPPAPPPVNIEKLRLKREGGGSPRSQRKVGAKEEPSSSRLRLVQRGGPVGRGDLSAMGHG